MGGWLKANHHFIQTLRLFANSNIVGQNSHVITKVWTKTVMFPFPFQSCLNNAAFWLYFLLWYLMWVEFTMLYSLPNVHVCCFLFYKYGDAVTFFQSDNYISNNFNDHYNGFIKILTIRIKQFLKFGQLANSLTVFFYYSVLHIHRKRFSWFKSKY